MTQTTLSLEEMLMHLHELSEKGLADSVEFSQAHDAYLYAVNQSTDVIEVQKAMNFLSTIESIGTLNLEFLAEQLEEQIN